MIATGEWFLIFGDIGYGVTHISYLNRLAGRHFYVGFQPRARCKNAFVGGCSRERRLLGVSRRCSVGLHILVLLGYILGVVVSTFLLASERDVADACRLFSCNS